MQFQRNQLKNVINQLQPLQLRSSSSSSSSSSTTTKTTTSPPPQQQQLDSPLPLPVNIINIPMDDDELISDGTISGA
ncbi:hypothetical protein DDB_G0279883 [Dictyostelium discoideum AX4]|uniref:hypothetical protein n=1 Tax=Dictyostelium discoideum AX4 TaxID=352472 RepID=UPI00004E2C8D|nr:hypothetical protein DDB_G0279883 [Dictyostelium discoideum AX4]EAL67498.1 hypothetical protein DDB_G0279883 [Dictyostelium discoideum AX4]|eukprot:XP_641473.1 hypothetical protein DDB_G0279883 [Dictyostelium discoideum AX4]